MLMFYQSIVHWANISSTVKNVVFCDRVRQSLIFCYVGYASQQKKPNSSKSEHIRFHSYLTQGENQSIKDRVKLYFSMTTSTLNIQPNVQSKSKWQSVENKF